MQLKSERGRQLALFVLRNLVLYFLLVNSFLQLREQLDPLFQSAAFLVAVLAALAMERSRLRILPALAARRCPSRPAARPVLPRLPDAARHRLRAGHGLSLLLLRQGFLPRACRLRGGVAVQFPCPAAEAVPLHRGRRSTACSSSSCSGPRPGTSSRCTPTPPISPGRSPLFVVAEFFVLLLAGAQRSPDGSMPGRWRASRGCSCRSSSSSSCSC